MTTVLARIFEQLILPPGILLLLLGLGFYLLWKKPLVGKVIIGAVILALYLLSTPYLAASLAQQVEIYDALAQDAVPDPNAGAIVVLSADRDIGAPEYGGDSVGRHTLLRTRYGAYLQRKTGLPILVSGGLLPHGGNKTLAQMMAESLQRDFGAGEVWLEDNSLSTAENALRSKAILLQKNIDRVYLVTQAWHMPRALESFEKVGLKVIAAPTAFTAKRDLTLLNLLPDAGALQLSRYILREIAARIWYRLFT